MKLTRKEIHTLYQVILNEMERGKNQSPDYSETLCNLEVKLSVCMEKNK